MFWRSKSRAPIAHRVLNRKKAMKTFDFIPQDWTRPLNGYRLAGWIEGFGLLAGVGAIPLLARLPWLAGWFWAVSLGVGLLVSGTGLYYLARSGRLARAKPFREESIQILADKQLPGRGIVVITRRKSQAVTGAGGVSTSNTAPPAGTDPLDDMRQASVLILLGVFILLPGVAGMLLRLAEVADAQRAAAYLGTPALMLWAACESLAYLAYWQQRSAGRAAIFGMVRSAAQVLAALLAWFYLGLAGSFEWAYWLFWVAAGLVLLSGVMALFMPAAGRLPAALNALPKLSEAGAVKSSPAGSVAEPLPPPESPTVEQELVKTTRAVFQVFRGKDGQFYFRLRAANGEIILSSEGYRTKSGCRSGIQSVRQNAPLPGRYWRSEASDGQYYFNLTAANHQVIGASEGYTTPAGREAGIQAVMRVAPHAGAEEVEWTPEQLLH